MAGMSIRRFGCSTPVQQRLRNASPAFPSVRGRKMDQNNEAWPQTGQVLSERATTSSAEAIDPANTSNSVQSRLLLRSDESFREW